MKEKILEIKNLTTRFHMVDRDITAVDSLSFDLGSHEILAIIGESGSGKSVTNLSIMKLIDEPGEISAESRILFRDGDKYLDLNKLSEKEMERIRGVRISMIFAGPYTQFFPEGTGLSFPDVRWNAAAYDDSPGFGLPPGYPYSR